MNPELVQVEIQCRRPNVPITDLNPTLIYAVGFGDSLEEAIRDATIRGGHDGVRAKWVYTLGSVRISEPDWEAA